MGPHFCRASVSISGQVPVRKLKIFAPAGNRGCRGPSFQYPGSGFSVWAERRAGFCRKIWPEMSHQSPRSPSNTPQPRSAERKGSCAMATLGFTYALLSENPTARRNAQGYENSAWLVTNLQGSRSLEFKSTLRNPPCQLRRHESFCSFCLVDDSKQGVDNVAEAGDMVTVHFRLRTSEGELLESSEHQEPLTFELGAGQVMGNPLFQSFDLAAMGMTVGETRTFEAASSDRDPNMVFQVPPNHPEMQRLEEVADASLEVGAVVELANGQPAVITEMDDDFVVIDANHPLAGVALNFEVELVAIDRLSSREMTQVE